MPHDLLTMASARAVEYLIALGYLALFIPFWRFVNGGHAAPWAAVAATPKWVARVADWFHVPDHVYFHPGHAWATVDRFDQVTVGIDDFAQKLVGRLAGVALPVLGTRLVQGERAWSLAADSKCVDVLSPIDGTVVAVNEKVLAAPGTVNADPYGEGWLVKVLPQRLVPNLKQLASDASARCWMDGVTDALRARISPDLGQLYQDGGLPVQGIAQGLDAARWDRIAGEFFLTSGAEERA